MLTFLDEAEDPTVIRLGELVVAGTSLTPAICHVVDLVEESNGTLVRLRALPGTIDCYRRLLARIDGETA